MKSATEQHWLQRPICQALCGCAMLEIMARRSWHAEIVEVEDSAKVAARKTVSLRERDGCASLRLALGFSVAKIAFTEERGRKREMYVASLVDLSAGTGHYLGVEKGGICRRYVICVRALLNLFLQ